MGHCDFGCLVRACRLGSISRWERGWGWWQGSDAMWWSPRQHHETGDGADYQSSVEAVAPPTPCPSQPVKYDCEWFKCSLGHIGSAAWEGRGNSLAAWWMPLPRSKCGDAWQHGSCMGTAWGAQVLWGLVSQSHSPGVPR